MRYIAILLLSLFTGVSFSQQNNNYLPAYEKVVTAYGSGDLIVPLGSGGNRGYLIKVFIGGGWAEHSATMEVYKYYGLDNFTIARSSYTYAGMQQRLRLYGKNANEGKAYLTLKWVNESPDKSWDNSIKVEISSIGDVTTGDTYTWNTNDITAFTGFADITEKGMANFALTNHTTFFGSLDVKGPVSKLELNETDNQPSDILYPLVIKRKWISGQGQPVPISTGLLFKDVNSVQAGINAIRKNGAADYKSDLSFSVNKFSESTIPAEALIEAMRIQSGTGTY